MKVFNNYKLSTDYAACKLCYVRLLSLNLLHMRWAERFQCHMLQWGIYKLRK
jgi:hypothetical protein